MGKVSQNAEPKLIPSVEGVRSRRDGKGKIIFPRVEIAGTLESAILEVKIGKTIETRLIKAVEFEVRRWPYILTMPISWLLTLWVMVKKTVYRWLGKTCPQINTLWFDGLGLSCRQIKKGAASWQSLDIIYNHPFGLKGLSGFVDDFWIGMMNAQAVRNRLKLVKQEVRRAIMRFSNHEEVRILSLAAGSTQGIIEIMAELKIKGVRVRALLLDIDQTALDYAMKLARSYGVDDQIETVKTSAAQVARVSKDFKPQIIEMLGLLDYIPRDKAIRLVRKIRESLGEKGIFLTCNICHNPERHFLKWVINWSMIYRTPVELAEIVNEAGFSVCRLIYQPLKLHGLVVLQNNGA